MRVAFVTMSAEWTGATRAFAAAARGFANAGDDVRFIVPPDGLVQEHIAREPFDVEPLDMGSWWLPRALRLSRSLSHHRTEVVFVHTEAEHLAVALSAPLGGRRGIVRRTPTGQRLELGWRTRIAARLSRTSFLFASDREGREAVVPARLGPVIAAPLGVPVRDGTPVPGPPDPYHIICVYDGESRGLTALPVRTVALMAARHPEIRLSIVGPGSDAEEVRMHVAALDILPRVDLLGERDDLAQLLRGATFGWIAGRSDDAAFAALDMMAAGLPAIAPDDQVCAEYVADGITGLIVRSEEATLAAGLLAGVIGNEQRVTAMAQAARARVAREFPETRMLEGFDRAVASVREGGAGQRSR
jgi:hypothetical protein